MKDGIIRNRIANHEAFIQANKSFFDKFFTPINWKYATMGRIKDNVGSRYARKADMKAELIIVGKMLKNQFDYGCKTNPIDIVLHFKRRYNKLFNENI